MSKDKTEKKRKKRSHEILFKWAGDGEQDNIEQLLKVNPELLLISKPLKDISGIELVIDGEEGITIFQHALWAGDVYMYNMMLNCLPKDQRGEAVRKKLVEQYKELKTKGVVYQLDGKTHREKQFSLKPLIHALTTYVDQYEDWPESRQWHWCTVVGEAQKRLPAYMRHRYCDPKQSFENPNFIKEELERRLEFKNLCETMQPWDSSPVGLGKDFAIIRGEESGVACACEIPLLEWVSLDQSAVTTLDEQRETDLKLFIKELTKPIDTVSKENHNSLLSKSLQDKIKSLSDIVDKFEAMNKSTAHNFNKAKEKDDELNRRLRKADKGFFKQSKKKELTKTTDTVSKENHNSLLLKSSQNKIKSLSDIVDKFEAMNKSTVHNFNKAKEKDDELNRFLRKADKELEKILEELKNSIEPVEEKPGRTLGN